MDNEIQDTVSREENLFLAVSIFLVLGGLSGFVVEVVLDALGLKGVETPLLNTVTVILFFLLPFSVPSTIILLWKRAKRESKKSGGAKQKIWLIIGALLALLGLGTFVSWLILSSMA